MFELSVQGDEGTTNMLNTKAMFDTNFDPGLWEAPPRQVTLPKKMNGQRGDSICRLTDPLERNQCDWIVSKTHFEGPVYRQPRYMASPFLDMRPVGTPRFKAWQEPL